MQNCRETIDCMQDYCTCTVQCTLVQYTVSKFVNIVQIHMDSDQYYESRSTYRYIIYEYSTL